MDIAGEDSPRSGRVGLIEARPSRIHGLGLFALQTFHPGEAVVEYRGERIDERECLQRSALGNNALFRLDDRTVLDGNVPGNPARWANHSCEANAEMVLADGRLRLVARGLIRAGDEITFDYGYDLTDWRSFPCRCGAKQCAGFIVAEVFRTKLRKFCRAAGLLPHPDQQD